MPNNVPSSTLLNHQRTNNQFNISNMSTNTLNQSRKTQKNSDLSSKFFCMMTIMRCLYSSFTRTSRRKLIYHMDFLFYFIMNIIWSHYRKNNSSKSLSYANYKRSRTSFCLHEFDMRCST